MMARNELSRFIILISYFFILLMTNGCSGYRDISGCTFRKSIDLGFESCLSFEDPNAMVSIKPIIESKIIEGLEVINDKMMITDLSIIIRTKSGNVIKEIGIGGFNPNAHEIIISINPEFPELGESIEKELIPLLAHEAHHAKRRRTIGYGTTLLKAMISEGLADHFSMETGKSEPPLWSIALNQEELIIWIDKAKESWNETTYDHDKWFFGVDPSIPKWSGYAIGYELVKRYLDKNPDKKASELHNLQSNQILNP